MARLTTRILVGLADLLAVAALSTAFALRVTPAQSVAALGQTVDVGTATPTGGELPDAGGATVRGVGAGAHACRRPGSCGSSTR